MNNPPYLRFPLLTLLIFGLSNSIFAQNNCESINFSAAENSQIQIVGMAEGEPYVVYTYDIDNFAYTTHCGNDCGENTLITPNAVDDQVLVYYDGQFCKAGNIQDLIATSDNCTINIENKACKPISIYEKGSNRFIADLAQMSHPFSPPPYLPGGNVDDPNTIEPTQTREYQIFNIGKNIDNALPLQTLTATCPDTTQLDFYGGCTDAVGFHQVANVGCNTVTYFTSTGDIQTILPGETFDIFFVNGIETYQITLGDSVLVEGRLIQDFSQTIIVDSGGEKDANGNCIDDTTPPPPLPSPDCEDVEIIMTDGTVTFTALNGAPITQAYIYNTTQGAYEFICYNNCSPTETVNFIPEKDHYLLGVVYYTADGELICFYSDTIN